MSSDNTITFDVVRAQAPWPGTMRSLKQPNGLRIDPLAAGSAPENEHVDEEIRQVFFKTRHGRPHRILFTIVDNQVRVLRVRGMGEDLLGPVIIAG